MIIDFHTHCFADAIAKRAMPMLADRSGLTPSTDGTRDGLLDSMDRAGVHISVVCPIATKVNQTTTINDWALTIQSDRILTFGTIHPDYADWEQELTRLHENGIKGLKLHPDYQNFYIDDKRMYPLYERLQDLDMIALFHAGIDIGLPEPVHCPPHRLVKVLEDFPSLTVVAAHMGGYRMYNEVLDILCGRNLYFDTSFSHHVLGDEGMTRIIKSHGAHRILFGTDLPWGYQAQQIAMIKRLGVTEEERDKIFYKNAVKLLETV